MEKSDIYFLRIQYMGKHKNNAKAVKQTVKYPFEAQDISIEKSVVKRILDSVIYTIFDATLYARS